MHFLYETHTNETESRQQQKQLHFGSNNKNETQSLGFFYFYFIFLVYFEPRNAFRIVSYRVDQGNGLQYKETHFFKWHCQYENRTASVCVWHNNERTIKITMLKAISNYNKYRSVLCFR